MYLQKHCQHQQMHLTGCSQDTPDCGVEHSVDTVTTDSASASKSTSSAYGGLGDPLHWCVPLCAFATPLQPHECTVNVSTYYPAMMYANTTWWSRHGSLSFWSPCGSSGLPRSACRDHPYLVYPTRYVVIVANINALVTAVGAVTAPARTRMYCA